MLGIWSSQSTLNLVAKMISKPILTCSYYTNFLKTNFSTVRGQVPQDQYVKDYFHSGQSVIPPGPDTVTVMGYWWIRG